MGQQSRHATSLLAAAGTGSMSRQRLLSLGTALLTMEIVCTNSTTGVPVWLALLGFCWHMSCLLLRGCKWPQITHDNYMHHVDLLQV